MGTWNKEDSISSIKEYIKEMRDFAPDNTIYSNERMSMQMLVELRNILKRYTSDPTNLYFNKAKDIKGWVEDRILEQ